MLKIKSYVKVNSLAEAYELNQKKTARVLGGMVWMKMSNRAVSTAIDLSGLGLDTISENDDEFVIGCMTPLRDLETNEALNTYTHGAMKESLCHIVGVQFRNCAKHQNRLPGTDLYSICDRRRSKNSHRCQTCPCHGCGRRETDS